MFGAASTNSLAFTGRDLDSTGLYFYRTRYYSPQIQRFISEDPSGFEGGINLYSYAGNAPTNFSDPFGLAPNNPAQNQQIQDQLTQQIQNIFHGSTYNESDKTLVIPENTDNVQRTLIDQGYQEPGQWWNPFLYNDPFYHSGGSEYRTGTQSFSFHFRERYAPCPLGARNPASCIVMRPHLVGRKSVLDQFHIDSSNPAVDPVDHIIHDFLHIPRSQDTGVPASGGGKK